MNIGDLFLRFIGLLLGIGQAGGFPPPLSAKEELEMFIRMNEQNDKQARCILIERNLRLVSHIVKKYYASYPSPDELVSIGSLGLMKAVDTFKYKFGTRFATYGAKCVQNEILMFFRSQKKTGMEVSIHEAVDVDRDGNPLTYLDIISVPDTVNEELDMKDHVQRIRRLVNTVLDRRERQIILLRYGLSDEPPLTQREVAKALKISRSYVSRIEKHALEKLKDGFGDVKVIFSD